MDFGVEVLNITETADGSVFVLDDLGLEDDQAADLLSAFFVLAFDQLTKDLKVASQEDSFIEISKDPEHVNAITVIRGVLHEGSFKLLLYFGGLANPETSLTRGLLHAAELLSAVRDNVLDI